MRLYLRTMIATAGLSVALTFAWTVAFLSWVHRLPAVPVIAPPAIIHPIRTIDRETIDSQSIDGRYVASTIKKKYHLPSCFYVKQMQHDRMFASQEEAEAAGYEPCSRCLPRQIARVK